MIDKKLSRRDLLKAMAGGAAATLAARVVPIVGAAPAAQGMSYSEAPMLADLVAAGSLPAVDQRIPTNPRVVTPFSEVGEYGGTWRRAFKGLSDRWGPVKLSEEGAIQWDAPDAETTTLAANYISEWSQNDDATQYTFTLRDGLKWSDGEPFTTEDVQFYYDKIFIPQLFTRPGALNVGVGENDAGIMQLEVKDALTWTITFSVSNPLLPIRMGTDTSGMVGGPSMAAPKHYLEKFLGDADSADQAMIDAAMAASGVSTWQELWYEAGPGDGRGPISFWYRNPDLPIINPWRAKNSPLDDPQIMERNPYYHAVDTEGNQLPYIDKIQHSLFADNQTLNLWIAQGLIDMQNRHLSVADYTFFKENEEAGGYKVITWKAASTNTFYPNISHPDPKVRELMDTADFRHALSLAINRAELAELVYSGLLTPRQTSPVTGSPQYNDRLANMWVEYDPDQANALLDGLGFTERDGEGYRLRDGERLGFTITYTEALSMNPDEVNVVAGYWEAIGIKVSQEVVERSLLEERNRAGDIQMGFWLCDRSSVVMADPRRYTGVLDDGPWAANYAIWLADVFYGDGTTTRGAAMEPPPDHPIRKIAELWNQIQSEPDSDTRDQLMQQLLDIHADHPYMIGTVGEDAAPVVVKNNFFNVGSGFINDDTLRNIGIARPKQFFIRV